ncbi:sugar ABC transporter ATP-binding protein [Bacillus sp. RG28]|uniref:Sugar ABC transporter ATP-binding protein n=1 Tax=Gottfriedia endophytica TaxID=2820819 RepID=A0A940SJZ1_9BACI|nr:ATP-binding cassette domain-containing protein [Gottfriedia endophytica]MBP0725956.1 sugar ABC transporter ATP-binding protein [Gottfriedia endophytica]
MSILLQNVSFRYQQEEVLKGIELKFERNKIYGFVGLNGAGKSTLMKLIAGKLKAEKGSVIFSGKETIGYVPQEVDEGLVQYLSVIENLVVASQKKSNKLFFNKKRSIESVVNQIKEWGINLQYEKLVKECSIYEKQMILIVKALLEDASFLLFDEPTSSLGNEEKKAFFSLLSRLKEKGKAIILILHHLEELLEVSDEVIVLRNGSVTFKADSKEISMDELYENMVNIDSVFEKTSKPQKEVAFEFQTIKLREKTKPFNLKIHEGEVVVIYGANGNGKSSLARTLWGIGNPYSIKTQKETQRITSPLQAKKAGLAFVPEERRKEGLFLDFSIKDHLSLFNSGLKKNLQEIKLANEWIEQFQITPKDSGKEVKWLSGGNQQKVSIAKWNSKETRCFLLDEPLKGVDLYAKQSIFRFLNEFCCNGGCVFYFTNDLEEARLIGDRIYQIEHGVLMEGTK